ncbi:unnamed protein product [Dibothriocephalus latus]|uniref:Uncharacterized protein n=1 Tax=Dibothriocephalus latus TaxID=60516 RepID=A0A3P7LVV3_DIBLA|nr:unnamed protein product [Dibothriocephalus latus]
MLHPHGKGQHPHHPNSKPGPPSGFGDAINAFKTYGDAIGPNALGIQEPVSFIDFLEENPKVKYKSGGQNPQAGAPRQSIRGEIPDNKGNTVTDAGAQASTNILFTLPLDKANARAEGSPSREDAQRSIQRSSTHTTTLSTECSNYQVHELQRSTAEESVSENAPSWTVLAQGRHTTGYRENQSRDLDYDGFSDRNDRGGFSINNLV